MILLSLLLQLAAPAGEARSLRAVDACMAALGPNGVDEQRLTDAGWVRVSTAAEEARGVRSFGNSEAAAINVPLRSDRAGCVVRSSGDYQPLIDALSARFGEPRRPMPAMYLWAAEGRRLLVAARPGDAGDRMIAISFRKEGQE